MLAQFAEKIAAQLREGLAVWAFFNNDIHGHAVRNALRLRDFVEDRYAP